MIPLEQIGTAAVPGGGDLRLLQRGKDFVIALDRNELMSSRMSGSEEALATMSCARIAACSAPHLLIGGYGMGFTLRSALKVLGPAARITVAELVPMILEWARGPMRELTGGCLDDPRVEVTARDVADVIAAATARYDAILLDVDNGPHGLVREANDRLYSPAGLRRAASALRPGGVLAVWSAGPDALFSDRLRRTGFDVEEVVVRARSNGKGPRHVIWFARKKGATTGVEARGGRRPA